MIDVIVIFLVGIFVGGFCGMLLTGLCVASGNNRDNDLDSNDFDDKQSLKRENNINKEDF